VTARTLRITFLTDRPGLSGGARVIADYARHLLSQGHDVRVFAQPAPKPTLRQRVKAFLRHDEMPRAPLRSPFFDPLGERFQRLKKPGAARAEDLPDADIVIANFWTTAAPVAALPPSKGAKLYFMQDYGAQGQPIEEVRRTWSLGLKTITINRALKAAVEKVSGEKARLVPCGVDPHFVRGAPREASAGPPTVGFVFSNNAMKGSRYCIEAIEKARRAVPVLRAVSFGPAAPREPLPDFIEFSAAVSDEGAKAIYGSADAWLFGSVNEGFGLPIIEAMAAGTPVIAARSAAAPDILAHGGGYLVNVADTDEMAERIIELCGLDADAWRALSLKAQATASLYSLSEARRKFEEAVIAAAEGRWNEGA